MWRLWPPTSLPWKVLPGIPPPLPLKIPYFAGSCLWPPWRVCNMGSCLQTFLAELSSRSTIRWLQHHKQSEEKSKEEWGPVKGSGESGQPPGMLTLHAWCSPPQLLCMKCSMQLAVFAARCVHAQYVLGSGCTSAENTKKQVNELKFRSPPRLDFPPFAKANSVNNFATPSVAHPCTFSRPE